MLRWLGLVLAIGLATTPADAQVFKPKAKKTETKKASPEKKAAKKQSRSTGTSKKRVTSKSKKKSGGEDAAEAAPKDSDKDFVKITDDDDVE